MKKQKRQDFAGYGQYAIQRKEKNFYIDILHGAINMQQGIHSTTYELHGM